MPHAIIEYSANAAAEVHSNEIVGTVHRAMIASGLFQTHDIKTRAYPADAFMVGDKGATGRFVHVAVHILEGRTVEQKQSLSQSLMTGLTEKLPQIDSVTVELCELDKTTYRKRAA